MEGLRRAQWALIRIENENVNNFERYRNVLYIPEFEEDTVKTDTKENKWLLYIKLLTFYKLNRIIDFC